MSDSLNLIGCRGNIKSEFSKKSVSQEKVGESTIHVYGINKSFSCAIFCCATADILTKLLQQCFLFFIVVVILGHNLGDSQVSVYSTIGPTLVFSCFPGVVVQICVLLTKYRINFVWIRYDDKL